MSIEKYGNVRNASHHLGHLERKLLFERPSMRHAHSRQVTSARRRKVPKMPSNTFLTPLAAKLSR